MDDLDLILSNISTMTNEIIDSYISVPMDNNLNVLTPIFDINNKLKPFRNFINLAHLNSASIPLHRDEIYRIILKTKFDIICFSETNIKKDTPAHRYNFPGYKLFHVDRVGPCGGVGVLIRSDWALNAKKINVNFNQLQPECIFIEIVINKIKICIGVLYKSPNVRYGVFRDIIEILAFLSTKYDHCFFTGDWNIDHLATESPDFKFLKNNIYDPLSLTQIVKSPTRITKSSSRLIDIILTNSPDNIKFTDSADFPGVSDHKLVYCSYSLKKPKVTPQIVRRRDFRNFVSEKFINDVSNVSWDSVQDALNTNIDEATNNLENIFTNVINDNAPMREVKVSKPVIASWMTEETTFLMDLRDKYKSKWNLIKKRNSENKVRESPSDLFFYNRFKELKNQVNHRIRNAKYNDFNKKINEKINNSKTFHFNLKKFNIVDSKSKDSKCHIDPNKLNQSFAKNNNTHVSNQHIAKMVRQINLNTKQPTFEFKEVNSTEIIDTVKTMKSNACGIDEISAYFIKLSISASAHIFAEIVNASLRSGYFPNRWKKARIKPIPKINDPINVTDFRPISLLIAFSKILEKIVAKQMKDYLIKNNLLDKFQSAYKALHSTTTALVDITDNIYKTMDHSQITILVLLDYSKAFDCANHKLILAKLKALGFKNSSLKWISSYLSGRSQQVVTDKGESSWINLLNGVPQGSILGPLLFTILVSDISNDIKFCKYHLYADDTQLYITGKVQDIRLLIENLNKDLNKIAQFSENNCLRLNEGKSVFIFLGSQQNLTKINQMVLPDIVINGKKIKREKVVRNLGIQFNETMSWDSEINKCISKGYGKLKQAYRCKNFLNYESKKAIVQCYLLSQFNYSAIILQNLTKMQMHRIQLFQNTCVRFIQNLRKFDHISGAFKSLGFLKMENLRNVQSLTLMHKIVNNKAPAYLTEKIMLQGDHHQHFTRNTTNIRCSTSKTNFGLNRFFNGIGRKYNEISSLLKFPRDISVNTLKVKLKNHYLNNQT